MGLPTRAAQVCALRKHRVVLSLVFATPQTIAHQHRALARSSMRACRAVTAARFAAEVVLGRGRATPALLRLRAGAWSQMALPAAVATPLRANLASSTSGDDSEAEKIEVPRGALSLGFSRSSGAGGQNVNKVNTKAEVRFDAYNASWLPPDVRSRLLDANPARVNAKGEFFVTSERHRTQHANLEDALAKLQQLVDAAAVPPKERKQFEGLSKQTKRRRVEIKRRRSEVKSRRRRSGDD